MMTAESTRQETNERPKWEVYSDEYGNFFFYNTLTGESTWELPDEEENVAVDEAETSVGAVLDEDTAILPVEGVVERAKASYTDYDIAAGVIDTMLTLVRRVEETTKQQSDAAMKPKKKRFVSPAAEVRYKKNQAKHERTQKREHLVAMTRYMNLLAPPVTSAPTDAKPRQVGALFSKEDAFRWRLEKEVEQIRQRYKTRRKRDKHHKQVYARVSQGKFLHVLRTELLKHLLAQITCSSELQQQRILLLSSPQYAAELEIKRKQQMEPEMLERYEQEQTQALEASIKNIRRVFVIVDDAGVGSVHLLHILFAMVSEEGIRKYATQVHGLQTLIESIDIQRFILDFTSKQRTDECMLTLKDFQAFAGLVEDIVTHFASVKEAVNEAEDEIAGAIEASSTVGGSFMRTRLDMASKKKLAQELASLKATHDEMVANQRNQIRSVFYGEGPSLLASKEEWEKHHQHRYIQHEAWLPLYCCLCRRRKWELWRRQLEEHEADHRSAWGSQRILKLKSEQLRVANQEDDTAITQPERLKPVSAVATISEDCEAPLLEDEALLTEFTKAQTISENDMVVAEVLKTIVILIDQMHEHQQPVSPPPRVHVRPAKQIQTGVSKKTKRKKSKKDLADEMDQVQHLMTIFDNEERERKTMHTEDVQMCILLERHRRSTEKPLLQFQDMAHNAYIKTLSHCVNPFPSLFRLQFERCLSFEPPQRLVLLVTDGGVCEPDMSAPSRYYILRTVPCRTEQEGAFVFNSNRLVQDKVRSPFLAPMVSTSKHMYQLFAESGMLVECWPVVYVVMEYYPRGTWLEAFTRWIDGTPKPTFSAVEALIVKTLRQVAAGLTAMHSGGALHLNIGLEHLFLLDDSLDGRVHIGGYLACKHGFDSVQLQHGDIQHILDPSLVPPEALVSQPITAKADVWMLGCALYESLMTWQHRQLRKPNQQGESQSKRVILHLNPVSEILQEIPLPTSASVRSLLRMLLQSKPAQRPPMNQVLDFLTFSCGHNAIHV